MKTKLAWNTARAFIVIGAVCLTAGCAGVSKDWPQWRGPNLDGISPEKGLLQSWPDEGPPVLWRVLTGRAYSQVCVEGDRAYTATMIEANKGKTGFAICLDVNTGNEIWRVQTEQFSGAGARSKVPNSTPLIHKGKAYFMGCDGDLYCLDAQTGGKIWGLNIFQKFSGEIPAWGFASSPVLANGNLIVQAGCPAGKGVVALNPDTGEVVWSNLDVAPNNSTPLPFEMNGVEQIALFVDGAGKKDSGRAVGLSAVDGKELWSFSWNAAEPYYTTPIFSDGKILGGSHGKQGATLFSLEPGEKGIETKEVWKNLDFQPWFGTSVLIDGYVYGFDGKKLKCFEFDTGKEMWAGEGYDRGQIIAADGRLIVLSEKGKLGLIEATPEGFREISSFQAIVEDKSHTIPSIADGRLYVRNWKEIACFDLRP